MIQHDSSCPARFPDSGAECFCVAGVVASLRSEVSRLTGLLNTPQLVDFAAAVTLEAAHQRERWGTDHDIGKAPEDWFWLVGYLAGKCLSSQKAGDSAKALHHTISTAAALANWHAALLGLTNMQPGHAPSVALGIESITTEGEQ